MKRDIKDFVSQKRSRRSKYHTACTVNNLPGFLDVQMLIYTYCMYFKARFLIKFEQTKSYMVPIFYLIISSCSMIDLSITSPKFLAHYVNCLRLQHQMRSEFDGFHRIRFSRRIHKIDHNSQTSWTFSMK
jgi:hypothetical protein